MLKAAESETLGRLAKERNPLTPWLPGEKQVQQKKASHRGHRGHRGAENYPLTITSPSLALVRWLSPFRLFSHGSRRVHQRPPPTRSPSPLCDLCGLCAMLSPFRLFSHGFLARKLPRHPVHRSISLGSLDKLRHPTFLDAFLSTLTQPADSRALPRT
jgi:hypothetical protein